MTTATNDLPVGVWNPTVQQGAAFYEEVTLLDDLGAPIDLTDYDTFECEFRDAQIPTATLEATGTVAVVGAPTNGTISVTCTKADTYDMVSTTGFVTVDIEEVAVTNSRRRVLQGAYIMSPTTIST